MSGTKVSISARRQRALELALSGMTVRAIGDALGVSHATAHRDVMLTLRNQGKLHEDKALEHRELIGERYRKLLAKWLAQAEEDPESSAGDKVLRALEGLRKLYGLDKPVVNKHEIGVAYPVSLKITKVYMVDGTERTRDAITTVG